MIRILSLIIILVVPSALYAQGFGLIVCDGGASDPCTLTDFVQLLKNVIKFLVILSTFLATIAFAYAGFLLLSSGGSEDKKNQAKKVFGSVLKGYLWILAAWVIVYTISSALLNTGFSALTPK